MTKVRSSPTAHPSRAPAAARPATAHGQAATRAAAATKAAASPHRPSANHGEVAPAKAAAPVALHAPVKHHAPAHTTASSVDALFGKFGAEVSSPGPRPADVVQAKEAFKASAYGPKKKQWADIVRQAIDELGGAHVMVNRPADDALALLKTGGRFSTIFDLKQPTPEVSAYLAGRLEHEQRLGTHGQGEQAGQTVYGSVEFSGLRTPEQFTDGYLKAGQGLLGPTKHDLNTGISLTDGAVTFVMKGGANDKSTFLPGDSYIAGRNPPRAVEQLPFVVLDNLLEAGDMYFSSERGSDALFELPREQAVAAVKSYLTSGALDRNYLEAQLRAPTLDDVAYLVIRDDPDTNRPAPDGRPLGAVLHEIRARAKELGIAVVNEKDLKKK